MIYMTKILGGFKHYILNLNFSINDNMIGAARYHLPGTEIDAGRHEACWQAASL